MKESAISAQQVTVAFRPYVDRRPTLKRSLGRGRLKRFDEVVALDDVSFDVDRGEAFGVIGRNGAGKTTLLRVLAGTLVPDGGKVMTAGRTSTLLQLGVGFNPELSGRRNVFLGGLAVGVRKAEINRRFDDIVEYAELEDAIDRPLKTYSSGMFARLAFAISMHMDPDIVLVDEVLAVGDEAFREKSMGSMGDLLDRSGTIVLVSHNLDRVESFCDRALWIQHGRIAAIGPAGDVVAAYRQSSSGARRIRD